jgi:hypothetical protein
MKWMDTEKVKTRIFEMLQRNTWKDIDKERHRFQHALNDVLTLLKEQEPVEPAKEYSGGGVTWWNVCGNCNTAINPNDKYCHECGRAVKWDG